MAQTMDAAALQAALATLTTQVANLTTQVATLANNPPVAPIVRRSTYVQKPATYDGKTPTDARRFLAAYKAWAVDQGDGLKKAAFAGGMVNDEKRWILTACSFLTGEAADWATSIVEGMEKTPPPYATYDEFVKAFRTRFETVDEAADALKALNELWMGKRTA